MRRSVQPLFHRSITVCAAPSLSSAPLPCHRALPTLLRPSLNSRHASIASITTLVASVRRPGVAVSASSSSPSAVPRPSLLFFFRPLSTSLPSGGAPASPSVSTSNPSFGGAHTPPHTSSPPPHQPAVGAHPPHSSAPAASDALPASVVAAGAGNVPTSPGSLPLKPDSPTAAAPPANESRLRLLFRQYGVVAVGSYLVIYVSTLGMLYVAIKERWLGGYDIQHIVDALGLTTYFEHIDPRKGDFAVAWLATKFTEPLRLAITVAITPTVARLLGRAPPKEGKGVRADVEARIQESVEQAKDRVEEKLRERREQSTKH